MQSDVKSIDMTKRIVITSEQVRAARALLRWKQNDLADVSEVSLPTIKRLEGMPGIISANHLTLLAIERVLTEAGIEFIPENGGGVGVRLKK